MEEAKPHWGLRPSRSSGTYRLASVIRRCNSSIDSIRGRFVVISPRTTNLSPDTSLSGSKEPERGSSYSNNSRCALSLRNNSRPIDS